MTLAQNFLYFINCITLILGTCLLGFSIYAAVTFNNGWTTFISLTAVYVGIAAGVFMMLVSMLGCAASAKNENKGVVCCYLVLVTGILGLQIAAAILIMQYSGFISDQNSVFSSQLVSQGSIDLNNGILSTYTACCSGCPFSANCNNTQPFFENQTVANCLDQNLTCALVQPCGGPINATCFQFPEGATVKLPPVAVDISLCTALSGLSQNNVKLVGPASAGGCGGGDPAEYQKNVNDYFSSSFYWVAIAFCVIAGLQALVVLAATYILCCVTRKYK